MTVAREGLAGARRRRCYGSRDVIRALILATLAVAGAARAAPPEPSRSHPRMLLDDEVRTAWRAHAKLAAGPVVGSIRLCEEGTTTKAHDRALYQGSKW